MRTCQQRPYKHRERYKARTAHDKSLFQITFVKTDLYTMSQNIKMDL